MKSRCNTCYKTFSCATYMIGIYLKTHAYKF